MTPLDYCQFPTALNRYGITSAYELQIVVWAGKLSAGLTLSNNALAEVLNTDRRTVINSINRLRQKGLVTDKGSKFSRVLVANSEIVSLLNGDDVSLSNSEKVSQSSESFSQNSEKPDTHNIKNTNNYILRDQSLWQLPPDKIAEYRQSFLNIDVDGELLKARQWLIDNPARRKTAKGMPRFLSGWLGRAKPGTPAGPEYIEDIETIEQIYKEAGLCRT